MYMTNKYVVSKVEVLSDHNHDKDAHIWVSPKQTSSCDLPWDRKEAVGGTRTLWYCQDDIFWHFASYPTVVPAGHGPGRGAYSMRALDRRSGQMVHLTGGWSSRCGVVNLKLNTELLRVVFHEADNLQFRHFTYIEKNTLEAIFNAFHMPHKVVRSKKYSFPTDGRMGEALDPRDFHPENVNRKRELCFQVSAPRGAGGTM